MKAKLLKGLVALVVLFLLLFFGRWCFLYQISRDISPGEPLTTTASIGLDYNVPSQGVNNYYGYEDGGLPLNADIGISRSLKQETTTFGATTHNYAREKTRSLGKNEIVDIQLASPLPPEKSAPPAQEETYEKVGSLSTWTRDFDNDEKKIRDALAANKALIQQENNSGLKGGRILNLALGVVPEKFDAVIEELRKVGNPMSFSVTKTDKTNDYKALMAQRTSIEKNKDELAALKKRGGKMSELLDLQERIFQLNKVLEDLGVQIGQFEGPTSLCTVLVTLREAGPALCLWVFCGPSFHWALSELFSLAVYALFMGLTLLAVLWAWEKGKGLPRLAWSKLSVEKAIRKR